MFSFHVIFAKFENISKFDKVTVHLSQGKFMNKNFWRREENNFSGIQMSSSCFWLGEEEK